METPADFIRAQLAAPYPRWTILAKLPQEVTAPFMPQLRQKWRDRNLRSLADVLRETGMAGLPANADGAGQEPLSEDQKAEIERWVEHV